MQPALQVAQLLQQPAHLLKAPLALRRVQDHTAAVAPGQRVGVLRQPRQQLVVERVLHPGPVPQAAGEVLLGHPAARVVVAHGAMVFGEGHRAVDAHQRAEAALPEEAFQARQRLGRKVAGDVDVALTLVGHSGGGGGEHLVAGCAPEAGGGGGRPQDRSDQRLPPVPDGELGRLLGQELAGILLELLASEAGQVGVEDQAVRQEGAQVVS